MDSGQVFPSFLKLEYQPDGSVKSRFLSDVNSLLGSAEDRFKEFSSEASRQLDAAMAVTRNNVGSLDLGVSDLRAAANAQQARATAAREVANATRIAAQEQQDYSQQTRLAIAATEALAREEEQAARAARSHAAAAEQVQAVLNRQASGTDLVTAATRRGTTAQSNVINSTRATRTAFVQLGQQMQDVVVQAQMGTNAFIIFAQQAPQAAFALSGLEGSANKLHNRIGTVATFLAGPWGAAVFAATAVLGPFVYEMIKGSDAADDLKKKTLSLTDALARYKTATDEARKAIDEYNAAQDRERDGADRMIKLNLASAEARLKDALATREQLAARLAMADEARDNTIAGDEGSYLGLQAARNRAQSQVNANAAEVARLGQLVRNLRIDDAKRDAEAAADPIKRINDQYDDMADKAIRAAAANNALSKSLKGTLTSIEQQRAAAIAAQRELQKAAKTTGPSASAQASVGDMTALLKQLMPGVRITSTTGGKHVKGSDHYAGRAIDFVPAGGMGSISKAEVEKLLTDAGVDIRRNAGGVKQFFGPGDKGHADHFHLAWEGKSPDPERVAAAAARAQQQLVEFGDRSAESIARISERFDEQPRLIDQVSQASRSLDAIMADLADKRPPGFEMLIEDAKRAKDVVADAIGRPFRDFVENQERSRNIQSLILAGREDEAAALQVIYRLQEQVGIVTREQREEILANIRAEERMNDVLQARQEIIGAYTDSIRDVRRDLEGLLGGSLSGKDFLKNMKRNMQDLHGRLMTEQLFGPMLRDLEKQVRESTGIKSSVDIMREGMEESGRIADKLGVSLEDLTSVVNGTASALRGQATGATGLGATMPGTVTPNAAFAAAFAPFAANDNAGNGTFQNGEIVVSAKATAENTRKAASATEKVAGGVAGMTPDLYATLIGRAVTAPLADALGQLGISLSGTLAGIVGGNAVGGLPGAIAGGLKGALMDYGPDIFGKGLSDKLIGKMDGALKGAAMGTMTAGLMNSLGIKTSTTGAQLGGAVGSFLPIPGGEILGSIAGGLIGGLFKKTKRGSAIIGGSGSDATISYYGNSSSRKKAAGEAAGGVEDTIAELAEALGGEVDYSAGKVSIGVRKKSWRVDTQGRGYTKLSKGAVDFGDDQEAAIAFAVQDLIKDGVIKGIRQSTLNILKSGKDLQKAIEDAVTFENVFKELKAYKDPVGAAIDDLNAEFEKLIDIFNQAGASAQEWAQLEELYGIKRAEAIKRATDAALSSLQGFYDFLKTGDTGRSLRDRSAALGARYQELKKRVQAGDTTANDEFVEVSREYLDVQRQLYGSQTEYFRTLDEVTATTKQALDQQKKMADAANNADSPFGGSSVPANDNTAVVAAVDKLGDQLGTQVAYKIDATNSNLGTMIVQNRTIISLLSQKTGTGTGSF